jgi:hypothetical protein
MWLTQTHDRWVGRQISIQKTTMSNQQMKID